ncbi:hypothetical protein FQN54_007137 [Arachnomyces sp. PD_36]|nr:hypothetical protein FQN54_007137 [Arachnomyces sp. PD_36]
MESKVPTIYQGSVSHIMDLVEALREARASGHELEVEEEFIDEIVYWGREVRRAWAKLNLKIRVGQMCWEEVQEAGVERYTEEEIEGFIFKAKAKQEAKGGVYGGYGEEGSAKEKTSNGEGEGDVGGDDASSEVPDELPVKEPSLGSIGAVDQTHQTVGTKSTALLSSQDDVYNLLREVARLQAEMAEGQKELLKSQKQMVEELKRLNINCEKGEEKLFADNTE